MRAFLPPLALAAMLVGCHKASSFDFSKTQGPNPELVAPDKTLLPEVNVANAAGWPAGKGPVAAAGLTVNEFAGGLEHSR